MSADDDREAEPRDELTEGEVSDQFAAMAARAAFAPLLDTLDGMVAETVARGFTVTQARAIVAYCFGFRPPDAPSSSGDTS